MTGVGGRELRVTDISAEALAGLTAGSQLLEEGPMGDKVRLTGDGKIIKFFYRKRWFSSALFDPYAQRFCRNTERIRARGVDTPVCLACFYERRRRRHAVLYELIPGQTLRERLRHSENPHPLIEALSRFLAELHCKGIYFRSMHFGNILARREQPWALIDVTDVTLGSGPLGPWRRARNFRHLLHAPEDRQSLDAFGPHRFLQQYEQAAMLAPRRQKQLRRRLRSTTPQFLAAEEPV